MNSHSITIIRHILRDRDLLHKVDSEWFYDKPDWAIKVIVQNLKENPKLFDKSLLMERIRNSNYNIGITLLEQIFLEPQSPFDSSLELLKVKYTRAIMSEQLKVLEEMLKVEEPAKVVNRMLELANRLPKFEKETKGILDDLSDTNEALVTIHTARRPSLVRLLPMYGSVIVIGGDSGHHKTNNGIDVACNALDANPEGFKVCFFSKEMEWKQIRDRILAKKLKVPFVDIATRKYKAQELRKEFRDKFPNYVDNFKIIPSESINSAADVAEVLMQQKPNLWIFDYIQLMADEKVIDVNSVVRASAILFKTYSKMFNNLCIELAQVRKKTENRKLQFPVVDDIEYAGSIKHLADSIGLCWWAYKHSNEYDPSVFITSWQKVRNGGIFNEYLEVNAAVNDMYYNPKFYDKTGKLKNEFIKYKEI